MEATYKSNHVFTKESSHRNSDKYVPQLNEQNKNIKQKIARRKSSENHLPFIENEAPNTMKKILDNDDIVFEPEEFEKNKLTNVDLPKFRFFDTKVSTPIMENDPNHRSLNGEEDPFPLGPEKLKDIEDFDKELELIKREIRSLRVKPDEKNNMSYSRIETKLNESRLVHVDETMHSDIRMLIKRANVCVVGITKENTDIGEISYHVKDMERSLNDFSSYYQNINKKMKKVTKYIKNCNL